MGNKKYHLETLAIHAGQVPDPTTQARAVPVYRTTAYAFKSSQHGAVSLLCAKAATFMPA